MRDLLTSTGSMHDDAVKVLVAVFVLWIAVMAVGAWATVRASKAANRRRRV